MPLLNCIVFVFIYLFLVGFPTERQYANATAREQLMEQLSKDTTQIELMLDGYEIHEINLIQYLLDEKCLETIWSFQVWLTARPHLRSFLENVFCVLAHNINPFSETDQICFLERFWEDRNKPILNPERLSIL